MNQLSTLRHGRVLPSKIVQIPISHIRHRAGGHWRSHAPASDPEQQQWDVETYKHWLEVIKKEEQNPSQSSRSGLAVCQPLFSHKAGIC
jgi:hypothetical protein